MSIRTFLGRQALTVRDWELSSQTLDAIAALIERNPFSERMQFLLQNQQLGETPVVNVRGIISPPNCIGTAFFIAGVSQLPYPYGGYSFELNPHLRVARKEGKTMYQRSQENKIPGALCFSYCAEAEDWHAGVYLGSVDSDDFLFAQHGLGKSFGPESERGNYSSPEYYLPSTLCSETRADFHPEQEGEKFMIPRDVLWDILGS